MLKLKNLNMIPKDPEGKQLSNCSQYTPLAWELESAGQELLHSDGMLKKNYYWI